jgi:translation initiation factor 3 subunit L
MIKTVETTVGRRYAGWFIRNGEYAQRVLDGLKNAPLPGPQPVHAATGKRQRNSHAQKGGGSNANGVNVGAGANAISNSGAIGQEKKVSWKV